MVAGARLYQAHYSHRLFGSQRNPGRRFVGLGEKIVLLAPDAGALFVWRRFFDHGQTTPRGTCCLGVPPGNRDAPGSRVDPERRALRLEQVAIGAPLDLRRPVDGSQIQPGLVLPSGRLAQVPHHSSWAGRAPEAAHSLTLLLGHH